MDSDKGIAWVEFHEAEEAAKCAEFMGDAEETDGVWKCAFKEAEFPELPPLKAKPDDPFKRRAERGRSPPRGGGGGGADECFDFKVGRCSRGDKCRFKHVDGGGAKPRDRDDADYDRDRSRRHDDSDDRDRDRERSRRRDDDDDYGRDRDRGRRRRDDEYEDDYDRSRRRDDYDDKDRDRSRRRRRDEDSRSRS